MKNKGFSLVELIVVIAIMAILVGVAVPVYSSYIEKSQISADTQMADEVKHALEIGMVGAEGKPADFAGGVVVVLSSNGPATVECDDAEDKAFVESILAQTFGASWANELKLKYDGWKSGSASVTTANYLSSSYSGNEEALLAQVQNLSGMLSELVGTPEGAGVVGAGFSGFLEDKGITDSTAIGNTAVLYVAQTMTGDGATSADDLTDKLVSFAYAPLTPEGNIDMTSQASKDFIAACGNSTGSAAATMYAIAEAYAQASGQADAFHERVDTSLDGTTSSGAALTTLLREFQTLVANGASSDMAPEAYIANKMNGDVAAYLSVLGAIGEAEDSILGNAGSDSCYTDGSMLEKLNAYISIGSLDIEDGSIAIVINGSLDGTTNLVIYPLEY